MILTGLPSRSIKQQSLPNLAQVEAVNGSVSLDDGTPTCDEQWVGVYPGAQR